MGATVFNDARVQTLRTASGQLAYLWLENTHCIKDGPKHASWCAMAFGTRKEIIKRIYALASSIPGGMLKTKKATPTAFVDAMLKLVEEPERLRSERVVLFDQRRATMSNAIHDLNRDAIRRKMVELGRQDLADRLIAPQDGERLTLELSVVNDFEVLRAIINDVEYAGLDINESPSKCIGVNVWKVFNFPGSYSEPGPTEPPEANSAAAETLQCSLNGKALNFGWDGKPQGLSLQVYRSHIGIGYNAGSTCEDEYAHVASVNGVPVYVGDLKYDHYALSAEVIQVAGEIHRQCGRNVLRHLWRELKAAVQAPATLPGDSRFVFSYGDSRFHNEKLDQLRAALGREAAPTFAATAAELARVSMTAPGCLRYELGNAVITLGRATPQPQDAHSLELDFDEQAQF